MGAKKLYGSVHGRPGFASGRTRVLGGVPISQSYHSFCKPYSTAPVTRQNSRRAVASRWWGETLGAANRNLSPIVPSPPSQVQLPVEGHITVSVTSFWITAEHPKRTTSRSGGQPKLLSVSHPGKNVRQTKLQLSRSGYQAVRLNDSFVWTVVNHTSEF